MILLRYPLSQILSYLLLYADFWDHAYALASRNKSKQDSQRAYRNYAKSILAYLSIKGQRIHLLTGKDDYVVGKKGMERLFDHLKDKGNLVSSQKPRRLPHHLPEMASPHIKSFLKKEHII